ncbi:hypothetical protein FRC98_10365 [Lujinxingia vulgaris]|uniref:Uncharacterized protein n=1 Tax=Lujinxingia vulgaris TaxID=2600176 RepID=A0A5C6X5Q9_9DELT|nr:hypothetical protein [Lujinxingia vulgaris]TXD37130.1 hypothetical protein FRC98_10365 [Lujinxingia vulgaris]
MKGFRGWMMVLAVALLAAGCDGPAEEGEGSVGGEAPVLDDEGEEGSKARAEEELPVAPTPQVEGPAGELAARVFEAHGGQRWPQVEELGFRFVVKEQDEETFAATHDWKVWEGVDRVRWTDEEGVEWDVTVNLDDATAEEASRDGDPIEGEALEIAGKGAYTRWVNDVYWLLMPLKVFDPGVSLGHEGELEREGETLEVLELSFEGVGLTPGDRYLVQVEPESGEVRAWEMHLQGDRPPQLVFWDDYQELGPLRLSVTRNFEGSERQIIFDELRVK